MKKLGLFTTILIMITAIWGYFQTNSIILSKNWY